MSKPVEIEETKFNEVVLKAKTPVLVDFWAPRCMPCRLVAPIVDELANEYDGKVSFVKLNVDENPRVANQYGVMSIPMLIIFKNGQPVSSVMGFTSETRGELKKNIDSAL